MSDIEARSVVAIARKDFDDAVRSKVLWLLGFFFIAVFAGLAALPLVFDQLAVIFQDLGTEAYLRVLQSPVSLLFPIIGLLLGYKSIAGELQSGTGKILHTLPHTRLDVIVGKWLGRTFILWITLAVGLLITFVIMIGFYDSADVALFLQFSLLSMLLGAAWVSIGVGLSALTRSTGVAAALIIGAFVFFYFVYDLVRGAVLFILEDGIAMGADTPTWHTVSGVLTPGSAYSIALPSNLAQQGPAQGSMTEFYTSPEAGLLILCAWIIVPLTIGYLRFQRMDL
jgi:ABC-2 type transport system permease protein